MWDITYLGGGGVHVNGAVYTRLDHVHVRDAAVAKLAAEVSIQGMRVTVSGVIEGSVWAQADPYLVGTDFLHADSHRAQHHGDADATQQVTS